MYEVILTKKILCPLCNNSTQLLQDRNDKNPIFYICHPCNFVGQVGVGPVTPLPDKRILTGIEMKYVFPMPDAVETK
ncbi:hypothetical protein [Paenibacillus polymyxa]|uniref:hypothetical protein n=1 Tax=Paenibacillus polymyxa TaxID=1406 RepID=UPI0025B72C7C|nr:hypothetical protein [Paenibacillus polymyxa]MDN4090954.1 hypothetical protein [Paenibacillus polymyxa]